MQTPIRRLNREQILRVLGPVLNPEKYARVIMKLSEPEPTHPIPTQKLGLGTGPSSGIGTLQASDFRFGYEEP